MPGEPVGHRCLEETVVDTRSSAVSYRGLTFCSSLELCPHMSTSLGVLFNQPYNLPEKFGMFEPTEKPSQENASLNHGTIVIRK
jgi:hypothetical protein